MSARTVVATLLTSLWVDLNPADPAGPRMPSKEWAEVAVRVVEAALTAAVDQERNRIIADFEWWQGRHPGERVPWQVIYIERPDLMTAEQIASARARWEEVIRARRLRP